MDIIRHKPQFSYCGLTVILSNKSRFDTASLLSAGGGRIFNEDCLRPDFNRGQCDIRTRDDKSNLLQGTKCVLLLGQDAARDWLRNDTNTLNEIRGSVYTINDVPHIASYFPQDCADIKNYEAQVQGQEVEDDEEEDVEAGALKEKRRHGRTQRKNYAFWLKKDVEKVKYILRNGIPKRPFEPEYIIYPSCDDVCNVLENTNSGTFFIDLETDENHNILCFSFSFGFGYPIFVVPVLLPDYSWAYSSLHRIFKALYFALQNNRAIAHNGGNFDFLILCYKYHLPIKLVADTMFQQHRCFPEAEKSLGHCLPGYQIVDTLSGRIPIKNIAGKTDLYVWSFKNGIPFPSKILSCRKTRENSEIIRVNCWRHGSGCTEFFHIDCTPDHKFRLKNGEWIEAKNLIKGSSLTKIKIQYGKDNDIYDRISYKDSYIEKRERAHNYIYKTLFGKYDKCYDIHHKDGNKWNNNPNNLEKIYHIDHKKLHAEGNSNGKNYKNPIKGKFWNFKTKTFEKVPIEKIIELYNTGMSQKQIGNLLGFSQGQISFYLKSNNIKSRTAKEGQDLYYKKIDNCTVISIELLNNKEDVYCLEVEDTECFSCNGVIIHNCTSLWTFEPFHKDEGGGGYVNTEAARKLWSYCGKDVYTMVLTYFAQLEYAKKRPGLLDSFEQVNSAIKPYLMMTIQGIQYRNDLLKQTMAENDLLMEQYLRCIKLLIGEKSHDELRKRFKSALPSSNAHCCAYFHDMLGYPVVGKGGLRKDGSRGPSLSKKNLYKLKLKHDNIVIDFCVAYREIAKESGSLKFNPWFEL